MAVKAGAIITVWNVSDGADAAVKSDTAPYDTSKLWCDTSVTPNVLKSYNTATGEWDIVNDMQDALDALGAADIENMNTVMSDMEQTAGKIRQEVFETYTTRDEFGILQKSVSTQFTQTAEDFEMMFQTMRGRVDAANAQQDENWHEFNKYIRFKDGEIHLGNSDSNLTLRVSNDRISFLQAGSEVAYMSNNKMYVTDAEFLNSLKLGKFAFTPLSDGALTFG